MWPEMEKAAHTLAYDGAIMGDNQSGKPFSHGQVEQWASATMPTLVIVGERSEPFFQTGTQALTAVLPNAQRRTLEGQTHGVAPDALAPVLEEFFAG